MTFWLRSKLMIAVAAMVFALAGCKSGPKGPAAEEFPTYAELAEAHNQRVSMLQTVYANGVIELRWRDRKGRHFEQGNLEMWLQQPRNTAIRVEKLGEVLLWLGSDNERFWIFDLISEDRIARVGRHETAVIGDEGAFGVRPLALLDLMAMTPLPSVQALGDRAQPAIEYSKEHQAWMIAVDGRAGPIRMYFDRQSRLPVRVEALAGESGGNGDADAVVFSSLRRYATVPQREMAVASFPRMPQLIDVVSGDLSHSSGGSGITQGEVRIAINSATSIVEEGPLQRVFDWERLVQALRPGHIEQQ